MALYRAKQMGTLPNGRRVREGGEIREEELEGRRPGAWMELVEEGAEAPPSPALSDHRDEIAIVLDEQPLVKDDEQSEAAPAASKRRSRKGD
jgi:hypothetical protein